MNAIKRILFVATLLLLLVPETRSSAEESGVDRREFTIVPYIWFPNIEGDVTIGQQTGNVDVGADALLDNTESAVMLQMEARFGRFGFFVQPNYFKLEESQSILLTDVDLTLKFWMIEFGGFFRLGEWGMVRKHPATYVDLLIGGRYWGIERETEVSSTLFFTENEENVHLTEPFVGLRLATYLTEHIIFGARGDVGGFGVKGDDVKSNFTWQAITFLGYEFNDLFGIEAGYRWLSVDMENEELPFDNEIDLDFEGAFAGISFRF